MIWPRPPLREVTTSGLFSLLSLPSGAHTEIGRLFERIEGGRYYAVRFLGYEAPGRVRAEWSDDTLRVLLSDAERHPHMVGAKSTAKTLRRLGITPERFPPNPGANR